MLKIISFYAQYKDSPADELICDTFNYLLRHIAGDKGIEIEIQKANLSPPDGVKLLPKEFQKKLRYFLNVISYKFYIPLIVRIFFDNLIFFLTAAYWAFEVKNNKIIKNYYEPLIKNADLICFAGGGILQSTYLQFWTGIYAILKYSDKYKKKVYFNAVGIEKPKIFAEHIFYKYLLNKKCVRAVTTRDNIDYLKSIMNKSKMCLRILDSACWTGECYQIKPQSPETIGIGVIRPKIFPANGLNICAHDALKMYVNIIEAAEKRGYRCRLFCNGNIKDYEFGELILNKMGREKSFLAPIPGTPAQMVSTINGYKALIAARLHANITAVSLGIPTVGIVWHEKVLFFAKFMNLKWNFITPDKFNDAVYIVNQLEKAISTGIDAEAFESMKKNTYDIIKRFLYENFDN